MKIKNMAELATTPERRAALEIAEAGLKAIDTAAVLEKSLRIDGYSLFVFGQTFKLSPDGKLAAVLVGKCAADGAIAFEKALGNRLASGVALGVGDYKASDGTKPLLRKIKYYAGTHPMPSEANLAGTRAILDSLSGLSADDTVLFLISGGGSTLLVQPPCAPEKMKDSVVKEKEMLSALFKAGATIQEINTVRKHMSLARGGFLSAAAHPAQIVSIIFSDVPGNELEFISSGPTVKDTTTVKDAEAVMKKYGLELPAECLTETPKDDGLFERVYNILALSNETALEEMRRTAETLDFKTEVRNDHITGEAREVGAGIAEEISEAASKTVFLYCGETTVTVKGSGRGGRNQELAMGALPETRAGRVVLSISSDGRDNGPHAGALADKALVNAASANGIDRERFLANNDSSAFFEAVGGLIETGDTGSNVSDFMIAVAG